MALDPIRRDYAVVLEGCERKRAELEAQIEAIGIAFQIATRLTSFVAVSDEPTIGEGQIARRERIPHEVPAGLSVQGLGLRAPTFDASMKTMAGLASPQLFEQMQALMASSPAPLHDMAPQRALRKCRYPVLRLFVILLALGGIALLLWWLLS